MLSLRKLMWVYGRWRMDFGVKLLFITLVELWLNYIVINFIVKGGFLVLFLNKNTKFSSTL